MEVRKGLLYSKEHEWVQEISDSVVRVGITEYAQDQLGDIVYIELPEIDAEVAKGESFTVVESVKAASDVYAPVSGTVVAVNEKLEDNPELINES
ncbi:MAG: glycine cleavage system protein GcvH, partial [Limnochordia bacterium]